MKTKFFKLYNKLRTEFFKLYNKYFCRNDQISIGGGDSVWLGWRNFDAISSESRDRITFDNNTVIPVEDNTVRVVYSSHFFEHLSDECLANVLSEVFRILEPKGCFLVKLPDFDIVLEKLKSGDGDFFEWWGFRKVVTLWGRRGVADTLGNRASMIFCGVWNEEYGDHFSGQINLHPDAYHGPVPGGVDVFARAGSMLPSEISKELVRRAGPEWSFNHRNAWSCCEFISLLESHSFEVVTTEKPAIKGEFKFVPDIEKMDKISKYYLARKPDERN